MRNPLLTWLNGTTLRPAYIVLFLDVPSRIYDPDQTNYTSVSYEIYTNLLTGYNPLVTHINMRDNDATDPYYNRNTTSACLHYIDKLASFGANYSPGRLVISPSATGYSNINFIVDNVRHAGTNYGCGTNEDYSIWSPTPVAVATNGLLYAGVPASAILYVNRLEGCGCGAVPPHITNALNVAGYVSWGAHSTLCNEYAIAHVNQGGLLWQGSSAWWIIETIESFNGVPDGGQGDFYMWFDHRAFLGYSTNYMDYQNTPVGAVTHVAEPTVLGVNSTDTYFNLWASGSNFATCAWASRKTTKFQAVGDPFVTR